MPLGIFLFLQKKKMFTEGANSFLEELLPFRKRLKTREVKSFSNRTHLTMDKEIQICSTEQSMLGLWYHMAMHW